MKERTQIICFDLDGVIAEGTIRDVYSDSAGWAYEKCTPIQSTIDIMWEFHNQGIHVIIHTARPTCDLKKTMEWLDLYGVVYDELIMNKPYAHVYVDDRNFPVPYDPYAVGVRAALARQLEVTSKLG
jgi:hypothetical protein